MYLNVTVRDGIDKTMPLTINHKNSTGNGWDININISPTSMGDISWEGEQKPITIPIGLVAIVPKTICVFLLNISSITSQNKKIQDGMRHIRPTTDES